MAQVVDGPIFDRTTCRHTTGCVQRVHRHIVSRSRHQGLKVHCTANCDVHNASQVGDIPSISKSDRTGDWRTCTHRTAAGPAVERMFHQVVTASLSRRTAGPTAVLNRETCRSQFETRIPIRLSIAAATTDRRVRKTCPQRRNAGVSAALDDP